MFKNKVGRLTSGGIEGGRLLPMILGFLYYLGVYVRLWISFWYVRKE